MDEMLMRAALAEVKEGVQTLGRQRDKAESERDDLAARIARVEALLPDEDDPYVHVHPLPGSDPDCAGCWEAAIRKALRGAS